MHDQPDTEIQYGNGDPGKSRSRKKRESSALQRMGEELAALADSTLQGFELPAELAGAIRDWRAIKKHEARRRQMQYIGRLMRELDGGEIDDIAARLESLNAQRNREVDKFHKLEEWRDRLLDESEAPVAVLEIKAEFPGVQEKQLRHLAEAASAEKRRNKPGKAGRELFRYLRSLQV